jgi:nucleotide-binding universal stress UspA family protein
LFFVDRGEKMSLLFPNKKIVVAVDGSEYSERAAAVAIEIAKEQSAKLVALSVIPPTEFMMASTQPSLGGPLPMAPAVTYSEYYNVVEENARNWVGKIVEWGRKEGTNVEAKVVRTDSSTVGAIVDTANEEKADLIVIGTRGLGGFKKVLLGSVSSGVVEHAHCSVLVVR